MSAARFLAHLARVRTVSEAIRSRQPMRSFLDHPIELPVMEEILRTANAVPSRNPCPAWKVYVLTGQKQHDLIESMRVEMLESLLGDKSDTNQLSSEGKLKEEWILTASGKNSLASARFYDAPVGLIFTINTLKTYMNDPTDSATYLSLVELGMFMQNTMLLAREKGLHTNVQETWADYSSKIGEVLDLAKEERVIAGMSIGYAEPSDPLNQWDRGQCTREELGNVARFFYDESTEEDDAEEMS